jgi:hypothetical protein
MHRIVGLLLAGLMLTSCATYQRIVQPVVQPSVKAYEKVLVLLHLKKQAEPEADTQPHVCLLDPTSQITELETPTAHEGDPPAAQVTETEHNFGEIKENGNYVHHFKVKNVGKGVLNITKILPG